jgi:hypothetical protein
MLPHPSRVANCGVGEPNAGQFMCPNLAAILGPNGSLPDSQWMDEGMAP